MNKCNFQFKGNSVIRNFDNQESMDSFLINNQQRIKAEKNGIEVVYSDNVNLQAETIAILRNGEVGIEFQEGPHIYKVNSKVVNGTTSTIENEGFSPKFDLIELKKQFKIQEENDGRIYNKIEFDKRWEQEEKRWKATQILGTKYHAIAEEFFKGNDALIYAKNRGDVSDAEMVAAIPSFIRGLENLKATIERNHGGDVQYITELKVKGTTIKNKPITGMLDLIVVKKDGTALIYDYKTSFKPREKWAKVKIRKMKLQQGVYRNILSNMGVRVESLNIVPIQYTKLNGLIAEGETHIYYPFDLITEYGFNAFSKEYNDINNLVPTKIEEQLTVDAKVIKTEKDMQDLFDYNITSAARAKEDSEKFMSKLPKEGIEFTLANKTYTIDTLDKKHIAIIYKHFETIHSKYEFLPNKVTKYIDSLISDPSLDPTLAWVSTSDIESAIMAKALAKYANGDWRVFKTFKDGGVIMFLNTVTDKIDVVSLRHGDLNRVHEIENDTLLGKFNFTKHKLSARRIDLLAPTVGNLELIKTVLLIQENQEVFKNLKLGSIIALSPNGSMFNTYDDILDTIENIKDNTELEVDTTRLDRSNAFKELHRFLMTLVDPTGGSKLLNVNAGLLKDWTVAMNMSSELDIKLKTVKIIQKYLLTKYNGAQKVQDSTNSTVDLLNMVSLALVELESEKLTYEGDLNGLLGLTRNAMLSTPREVRHQLFQIIKKRVEIAQAKVNFKFVKSENEILKHFRALEENNSNILKSYGEGTSQHLYEKMFVMDSGRNTMTLIDPDVPNDLNVAENNWIRMFRKRVGSLKVPLQRASFRQKFATKQGYMKHIKDNILVREFFLDDAEVVKSRETRLQAPDLFSYFDSDDLRNAKIDEVHNSSDEAFELDLELVLHTYMMNKFKVEEYNKEIPLINAIRTLVALYTHNALPHSPNLESLIDTYVGSTIFDMTGEEAEGTSLSGSEKKTIMAGKLVRNVTSVGTLGLNFVSGAKDLSANTWNTISAIMGNKAGRDRFGFKEWGKGLALVTKEAISPYEVSLVTALNKTYRMANRDLNSIAMKANRGIRGWFVFRSRLLFGFNAAPDYLHRMAILSAHMYRAGNMDAHTVVDGELVYDITKDKRFKDLFHGTKDSIPYKKQLAKFKRLQEDMSNEDGLGKEYKGLGKLPIRAFSIQESADMKAYSDSIFGNYDDETKVQLQKTFLGAMAIQFKTFMLARASRYYKSKRYDETLGSNVTQKGYYKEGMERNDDSWIEDENGTEYRDMWGRDFNEGILNTLMYIIKFTKQNNFKWKGLLDSMHDQQKSNLAILASDLSLLSLLMLGIPALFDIEDPKDRAFNKKLMRMLQQSGVDLAITHSASSFVSTRNPFASASILWNTVDNVGEVLMGKDILKNSSEILGVTRNIHIALTDIGIVE